MIFVIWHLNVSCLSVGFSVVVFVCLFGLDIPSWLFIFRIHPQKFLLVITGCGHSDACSVISRDIL